MENSRKCPVTFHDDLVGLSNLSRFCSWELIPSPVPVAGDRRRQQLVKFGLEIRLRSRPSRKQQLRTIHHGRRAARQLVWHLTAQDAAGELQPKRPFIKLHLRGAVKAQLHSPGHLRDSTLQHSHICRSAWELNTQKTLDLSASNMFSELSHPSREEL